MAQNDNILIQFNFSATQGAWSLLGRARLQPPAAFKWIEASLAETSYLRKKGWVGSAGQVSGIWGYVLSSTKGKMKCDTVDYISLIVDFPAVDVSNYSDSWTQLPLCASGFPCWGNPKHNLFKPAILMEAQILHGKRYFSMIKTAPTNCKTVNGIGKF